VDWRHQFYGDDYVTFDVDALGKPSKLHLAGASLHYQRSQSAAPKPN
jgi:hypothetical protein